MMRQWADTSLELNNIFYFFNVNELIYSVVELVV